MSWMLGIILRDCRLNNMESCFVNKKPTDEDIRQADEGLKECEQILTSGEYDLVVLDEINVALHYKLFPLDRVLKMLDNKNERTEVVLTGRYAPRN